MSNYVPYHVHTMLSILDSCTKYQEYIDKAKEYGMVAFAFSEHGNIYEYYHKKMAVEAAGMKYIHAVEAYVTENIDGVRDNYHVWLGAKNYEGFLELNKMISHSFNREKVKIVGDDERYYYAPRITFDDIFSSSDNIIVTTACIGGVLSKGNEAVKQKFIQFLTENKHRCFLEIQHHNADSQKKYNVYLYGLSKDTGIPLIAGTDTHAIDERHVKGRAMLLKSKGMSHPDEDEWDLVFKSYDELVEAYRLQDILPMNVVLEAIENTNRMADMVEPFELTTETKYPHIYDNPVETFKKKIDAAFKKSKYLRQRYDIQRIKQVVNDELKVYVKTGSIDFMLLQVYLREWEERNGIQCGYGRGSVSGSLIAYILGITQMDSLKFDLNFFRFMNPERVSNADIDSDYGDEDRAKVKYFLLHDHMDLDQIQCSEIITFNTIALKGAIRDVCRGLYQGTNKNYLRLADEICEAADQDEEKARQKYSEVFDYVDILNGTVVSVGSHPSGVLVTDSNIAEKIGLCTTKESEYPVSMLNMKELDALFYVKLDILGLDNIGIINETCKLVGIERLTPDNVNLEDEAVWKSIRDDTTSIFQWESDSAQEYLSRFMSDHTIEIAKNVNKSFSYIKWFSFGNGLIRPGCASFRDSVANGEVLVTGFKELDEFLAPTFGRITMQEDIMQFLVMFCGYSGAESDLVRRGIAKKYGTEKFIDEIHDRFIDYSHKTYGVEEEKLEEIFPPIRQGILDATRYAFSWNHSDAYSCTGYICGYLRYYYPVQFLTAAFNTFVDKPKKTLEITALADRLKVKLMPIKFRFSLDRYSCDVEKREVYKGIESIKYMNGKVARELYDLKDNSYDTFIDLLVDIDTLSIDSKQLMILIKLNYFSEFGEVNELLGQYEIFDKLYGRKQIRITEIPGLGIPEYIIARNAKKQTKSLFKDFDSVALIKDVISNTRFASTSTVDCMQYEREYLGYIQTTDSRIHENCYIVIGVDGSYSKFLTLYQMRTGNIKEIKCRKGVFSKNPIEEGDVIKVIETQLSSKWGKDQDGGWYRKDEKEELLTDYKILKLKGGVNQ